MGESMKYISCSYCVASGEETASYNFHDEDRAKSFCLNDLNVVGRRMIGFEDHMDCYSQEGLNRFLLGYSRKDCVLFIYPSHCDICTSGSSGSFVRVYRKVIAYKVWENRLYLDYSYKFMLVTKVIRGEVKIEGVPYSAGGVCFEEFCLLDWSHIFSLENDQYNAYCVNLGLFINVDDTKNSHIFRPGMLIVPHLSLKSYYDIRYMEMFFVD